MIIIKTIKVSFNTFHLQCINQVHNIQINNKIPYNIYDVVY